MNKLISTGEDFLNRTLVVQALKHTDKQDHMSLKVFIQQGLPSFKERGSLKNKKKSLPLSLYIIDIKPLSDTYPRAWKIFPFSEVFFHFLQKT